MLSPFLAPIEHAPPLFARIQEDKISLKIYPLPGSLTSLLVSSVGVGGVGSLRLRPLSHALSAPSILAPSRPSRLLWINRPTGLLSLSLPPPLPPSPMIIWLSIIAMPASARPSAFLRPKHDALGVLVIIQESATNTAVRQFISPSAVNSILGV